MEREESLVSQDPHVSYTDTLGNVFKVVPSESEEDVNTVVDLVTPREFITDNMSTYGINKVLLKLFNDRILRAPEFRNRLQQKKISLEKSLNPRVGPQLLPPKLLEEKLNKLDKINESLEMVEFHVRNSSIQKARIERELSEIQNATINDYKVALSKDYDKNVIRNVQLYDFNVRDNITNHVYVLKQPGDVNVDENEVLDMIKITLNPEYSLTENINKFMK